MCMYNANFMKYHCEMMQLSQELRHLWGLKKWGSRGVRPWGFFLVEDETLNDSFQKESPIFIVVPNLEDIKASLLGVLRKSTEEIKT